MAVFVSPKDGKILQLTVLLRSKMHFIIFRGIMSGCLKIQLTAEHMVCLYRNQGIIKYRFLDLNSILELPKTTTRIVKIVQQQCVRDKIFDHNKFLKSSNTLWCIKPLLDNNSIVGGNLRQASVSEDKKRPKLFLNMHHITTLVNKHYLILYLHPNKQLRLAVL